MDLDPSIEIHRDQYIFSGNITGGATPVPIPNTAVKPIKVNGTVVSRLWESRKLPDSLRTLDQKWSRVFLIVRPAGRTCLRVQVPYRPDRRNC